MRRAQLIGFAGAGLVVLAIMAMTSATAGAAALRWSRPHTIDRTPAGAPELISCPSAGFCAGVAQDGRLYTTSAPTRAGSWRESGPLLADFSHDGDAEDPAYPEGFDCVSANFCVELDSGVARVTTDAARNGWSPFTALKSKEDIGGLACPSAQLCVAYGDSYGKSNDIYTSIDPTAAASAWQAGVPPGWNGPGGPELEPGTTMVCPSVSLCLFGTDDGKIAWSADPGGGAVTWHSTTVDADDGIGQYPQIASLSCPTTQFCLALTADGKIYTSNDVAAGQWQETGASTPKLQGVSCASASYCIAITSSHLLEASTNPGAGTSAWTPVNSPVPAGTTLTNVSCPEPDLCAAEGNRFAGVLSSPGFADSLAVAPLPSAGTRLAWSRVPLLSTPVALDAIACPSQRLCVAADALGQALVSTSPGGRWRASVITHDPTTGISCSGVRLCVISDAGGNVLSSTAPLSGTWRSTFLNNTDDCDSSCGPSDPLEAVACPSTTLCWTDGPDVNYGSDWWASTDPAADRWHATTAWNTETYDDGSTDSVSGDAVACASARLCLGTGPTADDGYSGTGVWRPGHSPVLIRGIDGTAAACAGTHLCAILAGRKLFLSTHPSDAHSWYARTLAAPRTTLTAIDCEAAGLCLVGDSVGQIAVTDTPAGGPSAWAFRKVDPGHSITSIACARAGDCVIGDDAGRVLVAQP